MTLFRGFRRSLISLGLGLLMGASVIAPAAAQTGPTVTQVINEGAGVFTATVGNATMAEISNSNAAGSTIGSLTLTVNDGRGLAQGWHVSIESSNFTYNGQSGITQQPIPATGFTITSANTPSVIAGQPINAGGPNANSSVNGQHLDDARIMISANQGSGSGIYGQIIPVSLAIPAYSQVGTYTATLTVLITSGPMVVTPPQ